MFNKFINKHQHYIDFLIFMVRKEFGIQYKQTILGTSWTIINPFIQMIVMGAVFSRLVPIDNYFVFLFSGLLPWQFFTNSINKSTSCFINHRYLLQKAKLHKEIIPLSIILSNFIQLLISLILFIITFSILYDFPKKIILIIPAVIWILTITIGISLLTSSLNVIYRDTSFLTQSIMIIWFYATPILYSANLVPLNYSPLLYINPLTSIFELFRYATGLQSKLSVQLLSFNFIFSIFLVSLGIIVYKHNHKNFNDWL